MLRLCTIFSTFLIARIIAQEGSVSVANQAAGGTSDAGPIISEDHPTGMTDQYRQQLIENAKQLNLEADELTKQSESLPENERDEKMEIVKRKRMEAESLLTLAGVPSEISPEDQDKKRKKDLEEESATLLLIAEDIQKRLNNPDIQIPKLDRRDMLIRIDELEMESFEKATAALLIGKLPQEAIKIGEETEPTYNTMLAQYKEVVGTPNEAMTDVMRRSVQKLFSRVMQTVGYAHDKQLEMGQTAYAMQRQAATKEKDTKNITDDQKKEETKKEIEQLRKNATDLLVASRYTLNPFVSKIVASSLEQVLRVPENRRRASIPSDLDANASAAIRRLQLPGFSPSQPAQFYAPAPGVRNQPNYLPQSVYQQRLREAQQNQPVPSNRLQQTPGGSQFRIQSNSTTTTTTATNAPTQPNAQAQNATAPNAQAQNATAPNAQNATMGSGAQNAQAQNATSTAGSGGQNAQQPPQLLEIWKQDPAVVKAETEILEKAGYPKEQAEKAGPIFEQLGRVKQASDTVHWHLTHWDSSESVSQMPDPRRRATRLADRVIELGQIIRRLLDKELPAAIPDKDISKEQWDLMSKSFDNVGQVANEFDSHPASKQIDKNQKNQIKQLAKDFSAHARTLKKKEKDAPSKPNSVNPNSYILNKSDSPTILEDKVKSLQKEIDNLQQKSQQANLTPQQKSAFEAQINTLKQEIDFMKQKIQTHAARERELGHKGYGGYGYGRGIYYGAPVMPYAAPMVYSSPVIYQQPAPIIYQQPAPVIYQRAVYSKAYQAPAQVLYQQAPQPVQLVAPTYQAPAYQAPAYQAPAYQAPAKYQAPLQNNIKRLRRLAEPNEQAQTTTESNTNQTTTANATANHASEPSESENGNNNAIQVYIDGPVTKDDLMEEAFALKRQAASLNLLADTFEEFSPFPMDVEFKRTFASWLDDLADSLIKKSKDDDIPRGKLTVEERQKRLDEKAKIMKEQEKLGKEAEKDTEKKFHKKLESIWKDSVDFEEKQIKEEKEHPSEHTHESATNTTNTNETTPKPNQPQTQTVSTSTTTTETNTANQRPVAAAARRRRLQESETSSVSTTTNITTNENLSPEQLKEREHCMKNTPWIDPSTGRTKYQLLFDTELLRRKLDLIYITATNPDGTLNANDEQKQQIDKIKSEIDRLQKVSDSLQEAPIRPLPSNVISQLAAIRAQVNNKLNDEKRLAQNEKPLVQPDYYFHKRQIPLLEAELKVLNQHIQVQREWMQKQIKVVNDTIDKMTNNINTNSSNLPPEAKKNLEEKVELLKQRVKSMQEDLDKLPATS